MKWHVGCSGFHYKIWKDIFYPSGLPEKKWFLFYQNNFHSLELKRTFYKFPTKSYLQKWYDKSPANFTFAVNGPKLLTHFKQMQDCGDLLKTFYSACRHGLKEKLGPVLFQFPSNFRYTEERLQNIIDGLDNSFINVVEFRHISWWNKKVFEVFKKHAIIFCGVNYPGLPEDIVVTSDILYYRFYGSPKLYHSHYNHEQLAKFADHIIHKEKVKVAYCFFNNTAAAGAPFNAVWLENYSALRRNIKYMSHN